MTIFQYLEELPIDLMKQNLEDMDEKYYELCAELAGAEKANVIKQIVLNEYVQHLQSNLQTCLQIAHEQHAKAIYFEYDLDHHWDSTFFICAAYHPLEDEDDDWASESLHHSKGPRLQPFSDIYHLEGFAGSNAAMGSTLYLVARTVIAFKRAYQACSNDSEIAICIAFHDQDPIIRIKGS